MSVCARCQEKLSLSRRVTGASLCHNCEELAKAEATETARREQEKHDLAVVQYSAFLDILTLPPTELVAALPRIRQRDVPGDLGVPAQKQLEEAAVEKLADRLASDGAVAGWETTLLEGVLAALGLTLPPGSPAMRQMILGGALSGNLQRLSWPSNFTVQVYADEQPYWGAGATLVETVPVKEIRLKEDLIGVKGERLTGEHGEIRGEEVTVGSRSEDRANGMVYVTSHRVLFVGDALSFDVPYERLIQIVQYSDGVSVQSSDGTRRMLRTDQPDYVAVLARAAGDRAAGRSKFDLDLERPPPMPPADEEVERVLAEAARRGDPIDHNYIRLLFHVGRLELGGLQERLAAYPGPSGSTPIKPAEHPPD